MSGEEGTTNNHERPPIDQAIAAGLDTFEEKITQSAQEIAAHPDQYGTYDIPDGFSTFANYDLLNMLKTGRYDERLFLRYVTLASQAVSLYNSFSKLRQIEPEDTMGILTQDVNPDLLQRAYATEEPDGDFHQLIVQSVENANNNEQSLGQQVSLLQTVYGEERPIDLLKPAPHDPTRTILRKQLLSPHAMRHLFYVEVSSKSSHDANRGFDEEGEKEKYRVWMRDVVLRATDITDPELADSYVYAASRDIRNAEQYVPDIIQKIEALGLQKLAAIREFGDNRALADYSIDQLERTALLAAGDAKEIARLQEHDVHVVFTNKMGDHNNVLKSVPKIMDDERWRTVFIEIQGLHDIYRDMSKLHKLGIAPSTIVFAHHGSTGQALIVPKPTLKGIDRIMQVASIHARAYVDKINNDYGKTDNIHGYSMHGMEGFKRIVDEYMQPSRGIDDAEDSTGQKTIIFDACLAADEKPVKDLSASTGEKIELANVSVISQLAHDLAHGGVESNVVLYGANDGIQTKPTARGFHYTVRQKNPFDGREQQGARKIEIKHSKITQHQVMEVPLRNFNKKLANT
jgi:hypothetical protein